MTFRKMFAEVLPSELQSKARVMNETRMRKTMDLMKDRIKFMPEMCQHLYFLQEPDFIRSDEDTLGAQKVLKKISARHPLTQ